MDNKTHISNSDYRALHDKLAQDVIDFFKEKGLPENAWMIRFTLDDLKSSVNAGEWCMFSDSSIELVDYDRECLFFEM